MTVFAKAKDTLPMHKKPEDTPPLARWKIYPIRPKSAIVYKCDGCSYDLNLSPGEIFFFEGVEVAPMYENVGNKNKPRVRHSLREKYPEGWYCKRCLSHLSRWFVIPEPYTSYSDKLFWEDLPISHAERMRHAENQILS